MKQRPQLDSHMDPEIFISHYYKKEELVAFCKANDLCMIGNKQELTARIKDFLKTGRKTYQKSCTKKSNAPVIITLQTCIEENFICSQAHRAFYQEHIGKSFTFNVAFQKWLKQNAGKTYQESIQAYQQIKERKKHCKTTIDPQFEYNAYIRSFFQDNKNMDLSSAIKCWNYKKQKSGSHAYEADDLCALSLPETK